MPRQPGAYSYNRVFNRFTGETEYECDGFTCRHCQAQVHVTPRNRRGSVVFEHGNVFNNGGLCCVCWSPICAACIKIGKCDPIEEKIEHGKRTGDWRRWLDQAVKD